MSFTEDLKEFQKENNKKESPLPSRKKALYIFKRFNGAGIEGGLTPKQTKARNKSKVGKLTRKRNKIKNK